MLGKIGVNVPIGCVSCVVKARSEYFPFVKEEGLGFKPVHWDVEVWCAHVLALGM